MPIAGMLVAVRSGREMFSIRLADQTVLCTLDTGFSSSMYGLRAILKRILRGISLQILRRKDDMCLPLLSN